MRCVNERERTICQFVIVKDKLTSVFHASVPLLTMNFVITLSKLSADPLGYPCVNPQVLWRCYDEIHDQQRDRRMKKWGQFVNSQDNKAILSQLPRVWGCIWGSSYSLLIFKQKLGHFGSKSVYLHVLLAVKLKDVKGEALGSPPGSGEGEFSLHRLYRCVRPLKGIVF